MTAHCERSDCNPTTCAHSSHRTVSRPVFVILADHCVVCHEDGDLLPTGEHPECRRQPVAFLTNTVGPDDSGVLVFDR